MRPVDDTDPALTKGSKIVFLTFTFLLHQFLNIFFYVLNEGIILRQGYNYMKVNYLAPLLCIGVLALTGCNDPKPSESNFKEAAQQYLDTVYPHVISK